MIDRNAIDPRKIYKGNLLGRKRHLAQGMRWYNFQMPKISVLPDHIASQIAAGEVVERPSSVVKELVENAIDAGASQIEIAVGADCRDIRVADDGCGMSPDDAVLAFQRHATSKLISAEDLSNLRTLGFRGEALPSIASVSNLSCSTRNKESAVGTKIVVDEANIKAHETGCSVGTVIEVCDLFHNVPARLKFLKKGSTEFAHINEMVQSLALAYPKIVFQLLNQGEVVLKTSGSGKLAEVLQELGYVSPKDELISVTSVDMRFGLAVFGYVGRPPLSRGDRKGIVTIVNNRPVRCHLSYKALDYAFQDLIPKGKHPIGVITVTLDPHQIDVNVHPTKKEIRYSNSSEVYLAIQKAVVEATRKFPGVEPISRGKEVPAAASAATAAAGQIPQAERGSQQTAMEQNSAVEELVDAMKPVALEGLSAAVPSMSGMSIAETSDTGYGDGLGTPVVRESREIAVGGRTYQRIQQLGFRERLAASPPSRISSNDPSVAAPAAAQKTASTLPLGWRFMGYIYNTYMLFETPDGLKVIEQHIAHERLIYERILAQQEIPGQISPAVQRLVISSPITLTPEQRAVLAEHLDDLKTLGFEFDFQPNFISCTQVPLELATRDYVGTIQQIIEHLLDCDNAHFSREATKSLACQAAIKNGMTLTEAEIVDLVVEWLACPRNDTCPHGRPVCLTYSKDKLFQLFHPK